MTCRHRAGPTAWTPGLWDGVTVEGRTESEQPA